jgi:hypothetical protein
LERRERAVEKLVVGIIDPVDRRSYGFICTSVDVIDQLVKEKFEVTVGGDI